MIDAVTGVTWHDVASASPQSYVVSPPQWALYGIADGMGRARQFVGEAGAGDNGGGVELLRLMCVPPLVVDPRPLPAVPEPVLRQERPRRGQRDTTADRPDGDALVPQPILPDPYGFQHWDFDAASAVRIRFVSPEEFERRSGLPRPAPLDPAETYQGRRLP